MDINTVIGMVPELALGTDDALDAYPIADNYGVQLTANCPVKLVSGKIQRWSAADSVPMLGVVRAVSYKDTSGMTQRQSYWVANTRTLNAEDGEVLVAYSPTAIYTMLTNDEAVANQRITEAKRNQYASIAIGNGDVVQGSDVTLDQSTLSSTGTGNAAQVQFLGLKPEVGNEYGNSALVRVKVQRHVLR